MIQRVSPEENSIKLLNKPLFHKGDTLNYQIGKAIKFYPKNNSERKNNLIITPKKPYLQNQPQQQYESTKLQTSYLTYGFQQNRRPRLLMDLWLRRGRLSYYKMSQMPFACALSHGYLLLNIFLRIILFYTVNQIMKQNIFYSKSIKQVFIFPLPFISIQPLSINFIRLF